ncbi:hypothetical protein [Synechococcus sp. M16CYN]|uniref:hypothetical protein n=1 Tax=Synechococcus sp. M16CYN TaxID=3103139 RepID=UPI00333F795F
MVLTDLISQHQEKLDYSIVSSVVWSESEAPKEGTKEGNDLINHIVKKFGIDLDDFIYTQISIFDHSFENDPEWFDEEDTDEKDRIRDKVLELIG